MLTLYPPSKPYAEHRLLVDSPHNLYVAECGNPAGIPLLVVHGGPGSGCGENSGRYYNPEHYRIILFDQRGAGRSTPAAELRYNNTQALVRDMETIRDHLKIDRWILTGSSWGTTLSLVYAQTHPARVLGLILRGIFLARRQDTEWLYTDGGAKQIFPDYWQEFLTAVPPQHHHAPAAYFHNQLLSEDEDVRMKAAAAWSTWERRISSLTLPATPTAVSAQETLNFARIESHYFLNACFLKPDQILDNMEKIRQIPGIIVHGRYDMVCPFENAWQLHKSWPGSELDIIPAAGHSSSEPGIIDGTMRAAQKMAALIVAA